MKLFASTSTERIPQSMTVPRWSTLFLLFLTASAWAKDVRLENNPVAILGPLQLRLAFTDQNGTAHDVPLQQLSPAALSSLPAQLQQAATSVLLDGKAASSQFDQLWASTSAAVCGEIVGTIGANVNTTGHSAYDIQCNANPKGLLTASVATEWQNEYGFRVNGRMLVLDYWIPDNDAEFWVTTDCTCHRGSNTPGCAEDPTFTLIFDVHLVLKFTSNGILAPMSLPFTESHGSSVTMDDVLQGDYGNAVHNAVKQWGADLVAGETASLASGQPVIALADFVATTGKLLVDLSGIAVAMICEHPLRDTISSSLSELASGTAGSDSINLAQQFTGLFQNLLAGYSAGFSQFDIIADDRTNLILRWTAPPQSKPVLVNLDANVNKNPSLFAPTIGADRTQVPAGNQLTVRGNYFDGAYTTHLRIGWTDTPPPGQPETAKIDWGKAGGPTQHVEILSKGSFEADGLTPGTTYRFQVSDCTPLACTPISDWFSAATQAQGSDAVVLYLDTPNQTIGSATLGGDGTFTESVTIPNNATPGPHVIYASTGGTGPLGGGIKFMRPIQGVTAAPVSAGAGPKVSTRANTPSLLVPVKVSSGGIVSPTGLNTTPIIGKVIPIPIRGGQQAQVTIRVCGAGGCGASIAKINPDTNMPYPGGGVFVQGSPFILRGEDFAPNQAVGLYLDTPNTQVIGTASVNGNGSFQSSFTMPYVSGSHALVAIEGTGKNAKQAKLPIFVQYAPQ